MSNWTLFSNHGHVLVCLARDTEARLRDVAADVGITERAVQKIVRDLQDGGMISVSKHGRRNRYRIHRKVTMRHELEAHCTLGDLTRFVLTGDEAGQTQQRQDPHAEKAHREEAGPEREQPAVKSPVVDSTAKPGQAAPASSGPVQEKPGAEKNPFEESRPKQSEPKKPADAEPEEIHPIERQQRSLF